MSYVIYNTTTFRRHETSNGAYFSSERIAKSVRTKAKLDPEKWVIATIDEWEAADPDVVVKNMMSNKDVTIKRSQVGNPVHDVSMEGYWMM